KEIEAAVKPLTGARDAVAAPIMGKGYLEIDIDREKAARYGISVEDIQNEIEVALGGRVITYTVEKRDRFPVRIRYARAFRVDEAKRVVAQKVQLPEGVYVEWSGEFEHQVRAARTLRFVFPVVIALIFVILYLTYKDLADAALMMLAVPEALAGGAFFMYLFP